MDEFLDQKSYIMGDTFTLPDCYMFVMLFWPPHFKIDSQEWQNLSRYFEELKKRNSIKQALKEEGFLTVKGS